MFLYDGDTSTSTYITHVQYNILPYYYHLTFILQCMYKSKFIYNYSKVKILTQVQYMCENCVAVIQLLVLLIILPAGGVAR